jgi:beta-glucosidase
VVKGTSVGPDVSQLRVHLPSLSLDGRCVGNTFEIPRFRIPSFCFSDGPAGFRGVEQASAFPAGITVAATWDKALMRARGEALGREWRGKGSHIFLGPALDLIRAPAAGRIWESFGAGAAVCCSLVAGDATNWYNLDPYLTGEAGYETIRGVQSQGVVSRLNPLTEWTWINCTILHSQTACAKHLIGNQQEHYRCSGSSIIDDRTLHEIYWRPFQRAIEADVGCVMCGYNRLNGVHTCSDPNLIGDEGLLRREGGFRGFIVSDWGATHGHGHEIARAGLDVE